MLMTVCPLPDCICCSKKKNYYSLKITDLDRPMGIRMKTQLMTMETDIFIVFAEGTEVCKCESLFDSYSALLG